MLRYFSKYWPVCVFFMLSVLAGFFITTSIAGKDKGKLENTVLVAPETPINIGMVEVTHEKGQQVKLSDLAQGNFILLNVWATWCTPCVAEMPALDRLQAGDEGLTVVAVSLDRKDMTELRAFYTKHDLRSLEIYQDQNRELRRHLPIKGLPASYLMTPEGAVLGGYNGALEWDSPEILKELDYWTQ